MSHAFTSEQTETKSEIKPVGTEEEDVHIMRLRGNYGTYNAVERFHNSLVERLLAVSVPNTLENMRDSAGRDTVHGVVKMFHSAEFSLGVFKRFAKSNHDFYYGRSH